MAPQTVLMHITSENGLQTGQTAKIEMIVPHLSAVLRILGVDLESEGLRETPRRVAKILVRETFRGVDPALKPQMTVFENTHGYKEMILEKYISFYSCCKHHLVPFFGHAHVAYVPKERLAGLSKLNRLVQYLASKPQTQEGLTVEIGHALQEALETPDVAVVLEATHLCIASRGVKDTNSTTRTLFFHGAFEEHEKKNEFLRQIDAS